MENLPAPIGSPMVARSFAQVTGKIRPAPPPSWFHPIIQPLPARQVQYVEDRPACILTNTEVIEATVPFANTLILKFTKGRPTIHEIKTHIRANWQIQCEPIVALLDARHVMVSMETQQDMLMGLSRESNMIGNNLFRIERWTHEFSLKKDSYRHAIWMKLPLLPFQYFSQPYLKIIGDTLGKFIRSDDYTKCFHNFLYARICVEMDMRKELPDSVWIGQNNGEGFWQRIEYVGNNLYCNDCGLVGHSKDNCWKGEAKKDYKIIKENQDSQDFKEVRKGIVNEQNRKQHNVWQKIPEKKKGTSNVVVQDTISHEYDPNGQKGTREEQKLHCENSFVLLELMEDVIERNEREQDSNKIAEITEKTHVKEHKNTEKGADMEKQVVEVSQQVQIITPQDVCNILQPTEEGKGHEQLSQQQISTEQKDNRGDLLELLGDAAEENEREHKKLTCNKKLEEQQLEQVQADQKSKESIEPTIGRNSDLVVHHYESEEASNKLCNRKVVSEGLQEQLQGLERCTLTDIAPEPQMMEKNFLDISDLDETYGMGAIPQCPSILNKELHELSIKSKKKGRRGRPRKIRPIEHSSTYEISL